MKTNGRPEKRIVLVLFVALTGFLAGCGDGAHEDDDDHGEEEAPADHACDHAQNGPFVPDDGGSLDATPAAGGAPVIHDAEWTTVTLTDADSDGFYEGFLTFDAAEDGGHRFFTSVAWPGDNSDSTTDPHLVVTAAAGDDPSFVKKHVVGNEPGCVEVNFNHYYEGFSAGSSYTVEITGHPTETLSIVPVPATQAHE